MTKPRQTNKPAKRANLVEAMDGIFRPWFPLASDGADTWANWKAVLRAMDALPMSAEEIEFFKSIAGGREPPTRRVSELVAACARRTGKDSIASLIAAYGAALFDQQDRLRPGERAQILCLACDRDQSQIVFGYIKSYFDGIPQLKAMVVRETKSSFELNNGVDVTVATNSFRSVRGKPIFLAILDEAAFMLSETSASPDTELYAAIKPALLTIPGSRIVIISSPYRKSGLLWARYKKCFGKNDDNTLVIQAALRDLNPTISQETIDAEAQADPAAAVSELFGRFRDDVGAFLTIELIESAVDHKVVVRPPRKGVTYHAGIDPSGGARDSFAAAVSSRDESGIVTLDALLEIKAPFNPTSATERVSDLLKSYGVTTATSDRYAAEWPVDAFRKCGITLRHSERDRSKIYLDCLPLFTSGRARLLDNRRLVNQFASLERKTAPTGRDQVNHPIGGSDDIANACALSMVLAATQKKPMTFRPPDVAAFVQPNYYTSFGQIGVADMYIGAGGRPGAAPLASNEEQRRRKLSD
jgi:hypothetical protein